MHAAMLAPPAYPLILSGSRTRDAPEIRDISLIVGSACHLQKYRRFSLTTKNPVTTVLVMGGRARKRHVQLGLPKLERSRDKNQQWRGGARPGAGRPSFKKLGLRRRASERHEKRLARRASWPAHVILRAHPDVGALRKSYVFHAIREALITVWKLEDSFHVVQFSVQRTHIHMLVEANDRLALAKGMQTFGISAAKHITALIRDEDGKHRRGPVFPDRYHVKILKTPRQVRNGRAGGRGGGRRRAGGGGGRARAGRL